MAEILGHEVVSTFDFNQFQPHESVDQCGPAAVALCHFMGQPGRPAQGTPQQAISVMEQLYSHFIGPDVPTDTGGTSNETLYNMILSVGNHFQNLYPDGGVNGSEEEFNMPQGVLKTAIRQWVEIGYPVILGVVEDSVYDIGLKRKPYSWDTSGLDHIITVTGVASSGIDLLVRDTANVLAAGPRMYAITPLKIISATVVVPGVTIWLARPKSIHASDMEAAPVVAKPVSVPVVPPAPPATTPAQETAQNVDIADLHKQLADLQAQVRAVQSAIAKVPDSAAGATPTLV